MTLINRISTCVFLSVVYFIPAFVFSLSFFGHLREFELITLDIQLTLSFVASVSFSILVFIIKFIRVKRKQSSKIEIWFSFNHAKIFLCYLIFVLIFYSIKSHLVMDIDEIKEILNVQWIIFGISIAIFLFWSVFVTDHLRNNIPSEEQNLNLIEKIKYIDSKSHMYSDASQRFMTISCLTLNMITLVSATGVTYMLAYYELGDITLFAQNIAIVSFYFGTNALVGLFFDIMAPLSKTKKDILSKCKPTNDEVNTYVQKNKEIASVIKDANLIYEMKTIDDKQKIALASELLSKIIEEPFSVEIDDESEELVENHSEIKFKVIYGEKKEKV